MEWEKKERAQHVADVNAGGSITCRNEDETAEQGTEGAGAAMKRTLIQHTHKCAVINIFESAPQTIRARSSGAWFCKQLAMQVDISLV